MDTEPVTHIKGMRVHAYDVTCRQPDGTEVVVDIAALSTESAIEVCQDILDMEAEDDGTKPATAVSAIDRGPSQL